MVKIPIIIHKYKLLLLGVKMILLYKHTNPIFRHMWAAPLVTINPVLCDNIYHKMIEEIYTKIEAQIGNGQLI